MMYSIAVCAIGGIPLLGGSFTALGFFCGAWILTMVRNGLTMLNVDVYYEQVFLGIIILFAVSVETIRERVAERMNQDKNLYFGEESTDIYKKLLKNYIIRRVTL